MEKIKKAIRVFVCILVILLIVWAVIHRRVIRAWIKGEPIPEAPEWHKKCFEKLGCCKK